MDDYLYTMPKAAKLKSGKNTNYTVDKDDTDDDIDEDMEGDNEDDTNDTNEDNDTNNEDTKLDENDDTDSKDDKSDTEFENKNEGQDEQEDYATEEYEIQPDSDNDSDEVKDDSDEDKEDQEEEDLLLNLDNDQDGQDEQEGQDDTENQEDIIEDDTEEGQIFEDNKRKKTVARKKCIKKRLFPFLKKKKQSKCEPRGPPIYHSLDIREHTKEFLHSTMMIPEDETSKYEKLIYNASVRKLKKSAKKFTNELTADADEFKMTYLEILRYFIGAYTTMSKPNIINELKTDTYGWASKLHEKSIEVEAKEINKIKNPVDVSEYPDNPCPSCKGIKLFVSKKQTSGGDEGQSIYLWCQSKGCGYSWKIKG